MAEPLTFENSMELKEISTDVFQNVHEPWTWSHSGVIPGGVLMSNSAVAAYKTVPKDFVVANLQTHFLAGSNPKAPFIYRVQRLSGGRRFAVRNVTIEQGSKSVAVVTLSFVNGKSWSGPAMTHSVERSTIRQMNDVELDDLEEGRTRFGPFMKFQRMPLFPDVKTPPGNGKIAPAVARIWSPISTGPGTTAHIFGIINLTDYHVLDSPLTLHGITFGLPEIGSPEERINPSNRKATRQNVKMNTSLCHSIHFHAHDGFRADEICYIEVTSPWAKDGRVMLHSKVFSKDGLLIATCAQEGYYVLKEDAVSNIGSKL